MKKIPLERYKHRTMVPFNCDHAPMVFLKKTYRIIIGVVCRGRFAIYFNLLFKIPSNNTKIYSIFNRCIFTKFDTRIVKRNKKSTGWAGYLPADIFIITLNAGKLKPALDKLLFPLDLLTFVLPFGLINKVQRQACVY